MFYSLARLLLDVLATSTTSEVELRAEVVALRRQVQVLERQIKRVRWQPGDRLILAALRERLPRSAWAGLLVRPETVLGWHRELVRRRWAAYTQRPPSGRPPLVEEVRELIVQMARDNPRWGYFRIRGELMKCGYTVSAMAIRSVLRTALSPDAGGSVDFFPTIPARLWLRDRLSIPHTPFSLANDPSWPFAATMHAPPPLPWSSWQQG